MVRLALIALVLSTTAFGDAIKTADGITCSFDADESPWEVSAYIEQAQEDDEYYDYRSRANDVSFGTSISYKFGGPSRLDCGKLYDLELRTKEAKVKQLEAKVRLLERTKNVKWKKDS